MNYKYFPFFKEDVFSIFSDLWFLQCHWPVFGDKGSQETRQLYSSLIWSCPRYWHHTITIIAPTYIISIWIMMNYNNETIFWSYNYTYTVEYTLASKIQNTARIVPHKYYPNNIAFALTAGFPKICQCQKVSEWQIFRARKWWLVGGHKCKLET